ncbi:unnamed protein product [Rotaria socialis]|uniref:Uncharacterized protein n=1 Tax=Rotaria socialis TaxID=392032 RepID=A0A820JQ78_9BILA|nr:unnamed protein product [Rotaria socialis]CAF3738899.1 unnamed protein product [Rotaria socialis]CAF4329678.1 unnamed protein product [Rotaria socialis]CAF4487732.1 unnamed protein product [Rotaria socialis]
MYTNEEIDAFLKKIVDSQKTGATELKSQVDKNILKDLIHQNNDYRDKVIRIVAELCKDESQRHECVKLDFMAPLKEPLIYGTLQEKIESCRAIGNMCYENADGCDLVFNTIGIDNLFDVCRYSCDINETGGEQLRMMTLGALHNIINSNEKVAESIFKENIFQVFLLYVPYLSESKIPLFLFSICSNMVDHDTKCEKLISSHLLSEIGNQISESNIYDNRSVILPYLLDACEEDDVKEELCSSLFYYKLINLCEKHAGKDEEFLREACYLLVVLITADKSIDHLLTSKKYDLLEYGISWLEKSNLQLKMTGALIITNLTRNDQAAIGILADKCKPDIKLVEQLKYFSTELQNKLESMTDEQAKAVHGILGALRNLAVPTANRSLLVNSNVIDNVLLYIFAKNFGGEIAYKATGVIRFLLRDAKETSKAAIVDDLILKQIVANSNAIHAGLQFESRRVLFLLPIALKELGAIEALARNDAFSLITSTLASCDVQANRSIIQNEALIALNIILMLANGFVCEKLKEANFHDNLKEFLKQEIQHPEVFNNILQLILLIKKQNNFLTAEQLHEYKPLLENSRIGQNCDGRRLIDRTLDIIQNELK